VTVYLLPWLLPVGGTIIAVRKGLWVNE
jgi:hypothetical protein